MAKPRTETPKQRQSRLEKSRTARTQAKKEADKLTAQKDDTPAEDAEYEDITNEEPHKETPPSVTNEKIQDLGYSPFGEPVVKRPYTIPNIDPSELKGQLEEPIFTAPTFEDLDEVVENEQPEAAPQPKQEPRQFNPQFSELPNKEKEMGADMMADVVIDGYSKLGTTIGSLAKISENKLEREFADGNIDPSIRLPIDDMGTTVSIKEFVEEFNSEASNAFETSQEFKDKVKPPLVRVFKKRGVGMTDEQLLIYYFGTDLATKGITAYGLKKSSDGILENMRQQTEYMKSQARPQRQQAQPQQAPEQQTAAPAASYQEPEETTEEIIVETQATEVKRKDNFKTEAKHPKNAPTFGDPELLADMEKLAAREAKKSTDKKNK